jgi:hypothetical protein
MSAVAVSRPDPGRPRPGAQGRWALPCTIESLESRLLFAQIAVYGDMTAGANALAVANMMKSWNPQYIVGVGDLS